MDWSSKITSAAVDRFATTKPPSRATSKIAVNLGKNFFMTRSDKGQF
jgi:hypothetical protein